MLKPDGDDVVKNFGPNTWSAAEDVDEHVIEELENESIFANDDGSADLKLKSGFKSSVKEML